jgi:hypothetical protein
MHPASAPQFEGGQVLLVNLDQRQIRLLVNADQRCGQHVLLANRFKPAGNPQKAWAALPDAMRTLNHVRIGYNLPVRTDDHART